MTSQAPPEVAYTTSHGSMIQGTIEESLDHPETRELMNGAQLLFTSPPFPLVRKKDYGNLMGDEYLLWLTGLAPRFPDLINEDGSIVIEIGNAWEPGSPTMSTLPMRSLLAFLDAADLHLCQSFVVHNPARLPSPAQWVNIERTRVKDSYTTVWWMARSPRPKADNRRVLKEYSESMKALLATGTYNAGKRPSGHDIGKGSFLVDNGGSIPPSVLVQSNTRPNDSYTEYCRERDLPIHPARMAPEIVQFFVNFLTTEGDLVVDPFAGSNTTGAVAEALGRRWTSVEMNSDYVKGSQGRFLEPSIPV